MHQCLSSSSTRPYLSVLCIHWCHHWKVHYVLPHSYFETKSLSTLFPNVTGVKFSQVKSRYSWKLTFAGIWTAFVSEFWCKIIICEICEISWNITDFYRPKGMCVCVLAHIEELECELIYDARVCASPLMPPWRTTCHTSHRGRHQKMPLAGR